MKLFKDVNGEWFKEQLSQAGLTYREAAAKLGIHAPALTLMFQGKRRMRLGEAKQFAQLFGLPLEDILRHAGELEPDEVLESARGSLQVTGWVDAALVLHETPPAVGGGTVARVAGAPTGARVEVSRLMIDGSAFDGMLAYWVRAAHGLGAEAIGRPCIVQVVGRVGLCLRVPKRAYSAGHYRLEGLKGETVENEAKIEWAAPIFCLRL